MERAGDKGGKGGKSGKRKRDEIVALHGWEWDADELFIVEKLIGKMVAAGVAEVPGRTGIKAGTVLYKVLWKGFPPEIATWEETDDIPCGEVDFVGLYEAGLQEEEDAMQQEAESESEVDDE